MASVHRIAPVFALLVCFASCAFVALENECSRFSPEEIWYADYSPWINSTILEELRVYFRIIFGRLDDGNLFTFAPHYKNDTEKARELEEAKESARVRALAKLPKSLEIMERAWLRVGEQGRRFADGKIPEKEARQIVDDLHESFKLANKVLSDAGKEIATFFRMMMEIVVEGVSQIIESELESKGEDNTEIPEGEAAVAKLIQEKIVKIAPGNLLGVVVRRFIGRGLGTVTTSPPKEKPNVLYGVMPRIEKLVEEFKADFEKDPLTPDSLNEFWHRMAQHSFDTIIKRASEPKEDYVIIYRNEVYLAEVLMNIITMY